MIPQPIVPLLSIVTPVFNREDTIARCIESVRGQDLTGCEWIIVDDGSSDGTLGVIGSYFPMANFKLIKLPRNMGVNFARNAGVGAAIGEYVAFLDSDDYLLPDAVSRIRHCLDGSRGFSHLLFKVSTGVVSLKDGAEVRYGDWLRCRITGDFLHVVRRSALQRFRFFDDIKAFENLNWLRVFKFTEPQLYFDIQMVEVEPARGDALSLVYRLNSLDSINNTYRANMRLLELYLEDYEREGIDLSKLVVKTAILGMSIGAYTQNKNLIRYLKVPVMRRFLFVLNRLRLKPLVRAGIAVKRSLGGYRHA